VSRVARHIVASDDKVMFEHPAVTDESSRDRPQAARVIFFKANPAAALYCYVAIQRIQRADLKQVKY
jgi:hypothetical protein